MYKSISQLRRWVGMWSQHRDGRKAMGLNESTQGSSEQGKEKRKEGRNLSGQC